MNFTTKERIVWTSADLDLFPEDGNIYQIIDGELFVTRAPHWKHQAICVKVATQLEIWSTQINLGKTAICPGIIFSETDNVIPDVVWASNDRLANILDPAGHLTGSPELVVEVLSPGKEQQRRDRLLKLKLYSLYGVQEYWIFDPEKTQVEIYQRENALLKLTATLYKSDNLTSPILPEFNCLVGPLFA